MDSEDEKFLTTLNNQSSISSAQHLAALKEQEFEALFDLFEKTHQKMVCYAFIMHIFTRAQKDGLDENFPKVIAHLFRMIRAEDSEDATCAVCNDGEYSEDNMIIFCDGYLLNMTKLTPQMQYWSSPRLLWTQDCSS